MPGVQRKLYYSLKKTKATPVSSNAPRLNRDPSGFLWASESPNKGKPLGDEITDDSSEDIDPLGSTSPKQNTKPVVATAAAAAAPAAVVASAASIPAAQKQPVKARAASEINPTVPVFPKKPATRSRRTASETASVVPAAAAGPRVVVRPNNPQVRVRVKQAPQELAKAKVVIVGGGPVGLITALQLLEYGKRRNVEFHITIYERRWVKGKEVKANEEENPEEEEEEEEEDPKVRWMSAQESNNRRWQVVTIQSNVWSQLSSDVQRALFGDSANYVEMWPYGPDSPRQVGAPRNIPVRIVEDKCLELLQEAPYRQFVTLGIGNAQDDVIADADFTILAHGGGKNTAIIPDFGETAAYPEDPDSQLSETILGIFVQHPEGGDAIGVSESEGMALTVAQNRFLLNPLGRQMGFLNMWLTWEEARSAVGIRKADDGGGGLEIATCSQGRPCMMFNEGGDEFICRSKAGVQFLPAELKGPLWKGIQEGLALYGIDQDCVKAFTTFRLGPFTRKTNFFMPLRGAKGNNPRQPTVFLVGDAALKVSFKGGRGLNSGIKGALSLARTLTNAAEKGSWRSADFVAHSSFMYALQEREVRIRTLKLMSFNTDTDHTETDTSVTGRIAAGHQPLPFRGGQRVDPDGGARQRMMERLEQIVDGAFNRARLPRGIAPPRMDVIRQKLQEAPDEFVRVLDASHPQNTREIGGREVSPCDFVKEPKRGQRRDSNYHFC